MTSSRVRKSSSLEIEAQLQMHRPSFDVFEQLKDLGGEFDQFAD
ncbi:MAG: hypothetical protein R2865_01755 [Deinococcales bacterium]